MTNIHARIRTFMRGAMRWKVVFDLLTLTLVGLIEASYWLPGTVRVGENLVDYWFFLLTIFAGSREIGRWIGDHESGEYIGRIISHGEIYLFLFASMPFTMGIHEAFRNGAVLLPGQREAMGIATTIGLKVAMLYAATTVSKSASEGNRKRIDLLFEAWSLIIKGKRNP